MMGAGGVGYHASIILRPNSVLNGATASDATGLFKNRRNAFLCLSRNGGKILARVEQTLSRRVPGDSGDLRAALTEFAPALRCHYPGQAVSLETDSETYFVLRLWLFGDFLLRRYRLRVGDFRYMRALP